MEAGNIVYGLRPHPAEPLYPDVQKQKGSFKVKSARNCFSPGLTWDLTGLLLKAGGRGSVPLWDFFQGFLTSLGSGMKFSSHLRAMDLGGRQPSASSSLWFHQFEAGQASPPENLCCCSICEGPRGCLWKVLISWERGLMPQPAHCLHSSYSCLPDSPHCEYPWNSCTFSHICVCVCSVVCC